MFQHVIINTFERYWKTESLIKEKDIKTHTEISEWKITVSGNSRMGLITKWRFKRGKNQWTWRYISRNTQSEQQRQNRKKKNKCLQDNNKRSYSIYWSPRTGKRLWYTKNTWGNDCWKDPKFGKGHKPTNSRIWANPKWINPNKSTPRHIKCLKIKDKEKILKVDGGKIQGKNNSKDEKFLIRNHEERKKWQTFFLSAARKELMMHNSISSEWRWNKDTMR